KNHTVNPLSFCAGDPVNYFDPDGRDWYSVDDTGAIVFIEEHKEEPFDRLYAYSSTNSYSEQKFLKVRDTNILPSLVNGGRAPKDVCRIDIENVFYFAASVFFQSEWGLYLNDREYALVTNKKRSGVSDPLNKTVWKMHSHSDELDNEKAELESMGYDFYYASSFDSKGHYIGSGTCDWCESPYYNNDVSEYIRSGVTSIVFFPFSGRKYAINKSRIPTPKIVSRPWK
ncbi:MAG: hypothetical protein MJZ07_03250, partial [Bacteroidales bacterium]|nr:hypothetical protein [Bacteroidales bacterium]